jgi:hypothetical protein
MASSSSSGIPDLETVQVIRAALEASTLSRNEVVAWADWHVARADVSPSWLLNLSLSGDADASIQTLRSAAPGVADALVPAAEVYLFTEAVLRGRLGPARAIEQAFHIAVYEALEAGLQDAVYELDELLSYSLNAGRDGSELRPNVMQLRERVLAQSAAARNARDVIARCRGEAA